MRIRPAGVLVWLAAMLIALAASVAPAAAKPRLALVIGNSAYESIDPLNNAAADAGLVAETLAALGFEVTLLQDATLEEMKGAVADVKLRGKDAEAVLFYYSGHGFQLGGSNFLVPKDAVLRDRARIADETMQLNAIINELGDPTRPTMILIDACRNNPLPANVRDETALDGLAQVNSNMPNAFILFSTGPGQVARDGTGDNGPFALALQSKLTLPEMDFGDVMREVRRDVSARTGGTQLPWEQNSMIDGFQFNVGLPPSVLVAGLPAEPGLELLDPEPLVVSDLGNGGGGFEIQGLPQDLPRGTQVPVNPTAPVLPDIDIVTKPDLPVVPNTKTIPATTTEVAVVDPKQLEPLGGPVDPPVNDTGTKTSDLPVTPPVEEPDPVEVAMLVQTELKRIGCYTSTIDGDWGNGSRNALKRYFDAKKLEPTGTEPTLALKTSLAAETGKVCIAADPPPKKKTTTTTTANTGGSNDVATPKPKVDNGGGTTKKPMVIIGGFR